MQKLLVFYLMKRQRYNHYFFNVKLIYSLNTPFYLRKKKSKINEYKAMQLRMGNVAIKRTCNNVFFTIFLVGTGKVIASFSSKMFQSVKGKKQTFKEGLITKMSFVAGAKAFKNRIYDVRFVHRRFIKFRKIKSIFYGLKRAGLMLRGVITKRLRAHNGCRGKVKRRI